jgi:Domain of unknown function (DUF5089)/Snare region anchored in the vesicle membrane C-terminus
MSSVDSLDIFNIMENEKIKNLQQANLERLGEVLRISKETEYIAQNTCVELRSQNETIDRIADKSLQVSSNIDKSERIVRGMSSFFGRIKNAFSKPKAPEKFPVIKKPAEKPPISNPQEFSGGLKTTSSSYLPEEDKYLDEILMSVDNVKSMAQNISNTLDYQNQKLDSIADITDKSNARLEKLQLKTKKLLL